jgi:hypothetical protein
MHFLPFLWQVENLPNSKRRYDSCKSFRDYILWGGNNARAILLYFDVAQDPAAVVLTHSLRPLLPLQSPPLLPPLVQQPSLPPLAAVHAYTSQLVQSEDLVTVEGQICILRELAVMHVQLKWMSKQPEALDSKRTRLTSELQNCMSVQ